MAPSATSAYSGILAARLISLVLMAIMLALVAERMAPEDYGRLTLLVGLAQVAAAGLINWPNRVFVRFGYAQFLDSGGAGKLIGARLTLWVASIPIAALVLMLARPLWGDVLATDDSLLLLLLTMAAFAASEVGMATAQTAGRFHGFGLSAILVRLFQVALLTAAITDWRWLALAAAAGWAVSAVWSFARVPAALWRGLGVHWADIRLILCHGWAVPVASLAATAMTVMDAWFVAAYHDMHEAGLYGWAYAVSLLAMAVLAPLSAVLTPAAVADRVAGNATLQTRIDLYAAVTTLACALAPAVVAVVVVVVGVVDFGNYEAALPSALILGVAVLCQLPLALMEPALYAQERHIPAAAAVAVTMALVNAGGNFLLVPAFGAEGAAVATVMAYGAGIPLYLAVLHDAARVTISPRAGLAGIMLAINLALVLLFGVPGGGLTSYAALCLASAAVMVVGVWRFGLLAPLRTAVIRLWRA